MKITIIILKLLFIGALLIVGNHELYLKNADDRGIFFDLYYSWLDSLFIQGLKVTSYVVKFEWLPGLNETYLNK